MFSLSLHFHEKEKDVIRFTLVERELSNNVINDYYLGEDPQF